MIRPVLLRRAAQAEFDDAVDWYEGRKVGHGEVFASAIRKVLLGIASMPEAHPVALGDVREALIPRFPFAIYYRPKPVQIIVLAVFHTARDPAGWQDRT